MIASKNREQLKVELRKMFCNYIQESNDIATFFEIAMNYIDDQGKIGYDEAIALVEEVIAGK